MNSFILLYCADNQDIAQKFSKDLTAVGAEIKHFIANEGNEIMKLRDFKQPIIALVSDNFLKNEASLKGAMLVFADMIKTGQVIVLVTEGKHQQADGSYKTSPTQFERVSNVIQYMNYWQDCYLDARKKHNHGEISDEKLASIREISNQIGDFIRMLRESNYHYFENMVARNYLQFCQMTGLPQPTSVSEYTTSSIPNIPVAAPIVETPTPIVVPIIAEEIPTIEAILPAEIPTEQPIEITASMPEAPESQPIEEAIIGLQKHQSEDDALEEILADIPGLDLLQEKAPIIPVLKSTDNQHFTSTEIDEDDFFAEKNQHPAGSNVNQIIEEVLREEDDDDDDEFFTTQKGEKSGDLQDIFNQDDDDDDTDDELFDEIMNGSASSASEISEKTTHKVAEAAAPISDDAPHSPEAVSSVVENMNEEIEDENEEQIIDNQELIENTVSETSRLAEMKAEVETQPENLRLRLRYAVALAQLQNNWQAATKQIEFVLEKDPKNPDANFLLGEMSEANHDFLSALSYYEKVEKISPYYPNINTKLAELTLAHLENEEKQAKKYYKKAIEQEEGNADLTYAYATFLAEKMNEGEKAIKFFKKTLKIDAKHPFAYYDIAVIYHQLGDPYSAQNFYEKACQNNPEIKTEDNDAVFKIPNILSAERAEEAIQAGVEQDAEMQAFNNLIGEKNIQTIENEPITNENIETPSFSAEIISAVNETEVIELVRSRPDKTKPNPDAKIVLITGATSGIGRATAEILAKEGYNLILTGRREERLNEMSERFNGTFTGSTHTLAFDITKLSEVEKAVQSLDKEWFNIDVLLNNAGLGLGLHPIHEAIIEHWETMIDTNIKGLLYMTRLVSPQMVEKRSGHIINLCSTAGKEAYPNGNVYCATKFAVDALTKCMRLDLHKHNIRVSQVAPGAVEETEFSLVRYEGDAAKADKVYADFQALRANDVAEVIHFVISRPPHVNIQDVLLMGTQQASATVIDRSGRI
jgi:NADP-dependent 3-hydroxy acid dehydrogenase YdfG/Tfp pilus assembly protein PilF